MRTISAASLAKVQAQYGTEPINIVEIQWVQDGPRLSYADRDLDSGTIKGRITDVTGLDFVINVSQGSDSAEISITLSDVDGDLKTIIDTTDIHKRDVWIYQWYDGLDTDEKFLVFRGEINSPIVWNEGDRTLRFSVITKIEDAEIGFSIEEGQFQVPNPELIGKAWPLKFGTTINVPALRFTTPRKGVLSTGVGIKDFTLPFRIEAANDLICPTVFRGFLARRAGATLGITIKAVYTVDEGCALNKCTTIQNLETQLEEQSKYEFTQIVIIDGEKFPQGVQITLNIDGGKFTGQFLGTPESPSNIFSIVSREHPDLAEIGIPTTDSVNAILESERQNAIVNDCGGVTGGGSTPFSTDPTGSISQPQDESRRRVEESEISHAFYNAVPTSSFFWANPGSTVTIDNGEPIVYVSNLLPETVHRVTAYRNFDGGVRTLVTVPASLYTVRTTDFQSYNVTEIVFSKPLSQIHEGWEDDIYVTATSTVGPNTVNIMEWLIGKYTSLGTDTASFNDVRAKLTVYPMDFPYLDRRNILTALQELAFQARCAIYLRDGVFYLKYLPELANAVATITESDPDANTLELFHSDTEDIVTKLVADWQRDYALEDSNKLILRHNVYKYGTQEETYDFYAFNELDYVHKSATFWLIRKANTWRQLRFRTPLQLLPLETFDTVDLTLDDMSSITVPGLIEKADYNSNERALDFEIWTPLKSGTTVPYDFAHPKDIDEELIWPTDEEYAAGLVGSGTAPGFSVAAPAGHPLNGDQPGLIQGFSFGPCASQGLDLVSLVNVTENPGGFPRQEQKMTCGGGDGDVYPSDEGDTVKPKDLEGGAPPDSPVDPGDINVGDGPTKNFGGNDDLTELKRRLDYLERVARQSQAVSNNANEAAGGSGSGTNNQDPGITDLPSGDDLDPYCTFTAQVFVHRAKTLFKTGEVGSQDSGFIGVSESVRTDKFTFDTCDEAQAFVAGIIAKFNARQSAEDISKDEVLPVNAVSSCPIYSPPCEGCNELPVPVAFDTSGAEPETADNDSIGEYYADALENAPEIECPEEE